MVKIEKNKYSAIGINRLLGECGIFLPLYGENIRNQKISEKVKNIDKSMFYRFEGNSETMDTVKLMNENASIILEDCSLGDIPILIR